MIRSVSDSIADVKFGSQQIAKAYYGSDLVWEKDDEFIILQIGTSHADDPNGILLGGNDGLIPYPTTSNDVKSVYAADGFQIESGTTPSPYANVNYTLIHSFDGAVNDNGAYLSAKTSLTALTVYVAFPFAVDLLALSFYQRNTSSNTSKRPTTLNIYSLSDGQAAGENDANYAACFVNGTLTNANTFSRTFGNLQNNTGVGKLKLVFDNFRKSTSGGDDASYLAVGEIKMTVKVKKRDYLAWKSEYGLTNNINIP